MSSIGILGHGEIGKAIASFYDTPKIKDLSSGLDDDFEGIEVLNICIPYYKDFIKDMVILINQYLPTLTIIHSTVLPRTTQSVQGSVKRECMVVHSPVRGVHPNLREGIEKMVKYVGTDFPIAGTEAKKHLNAMGIKNVQVFQDSIHTELGKLMSTTYYAVAVAWHGEMANMCEQYGIDFEKAVTHFNKTYNQGYKDLGMDHVVRPTLWPPDDSIIGGHCLISNAKLLKKVTTSTALDLILEYEEK